MDDFADGNYAWYVVQNRPGDLNPTDAALIRINHSAYVYQKWGVPLVWVFPYSEYLACQEAERRQRP